MLRRPLARAYLAVFRSQVLATATSACVLSMLTGCGGGIRTALSSTGASSPTTPTASNTGPQLGYVWNTRAQTLRPVLGVPGSSYFGQSVVPAEVYINAVTSALSSLALLQENDGSLNLMSLPAGQPARLSATAAAGAQLRLSPSGVNAIVFLPGATQITLLTSLATTPAVSSLSFSSPITDAAVSDNATVAGALAQRGGAVIRTISSTGASVAAGSVTALGGLAFVGSTENLLLADSTQNSLTLVQNSSSIPAPVLLGSASLLKSPQGVAATRDGHWAILSNTGDTNIVRVDLTSQSAPQVFACACQPSTVAPLSGLGVFRVTPAETGPAWIFDAAAATPRVLFIPASATPTTVTQ